ncbi:MAG: bifunctional lysylphosphatidylglycerol flippase/synthetase MprF [Sphingomonas taxi]|uniref:Bifunctional lysylphosphatidylglycerol flippase/synthetase MprF n=1 Tax=Sphingomonas taxi TaxID=1549858 RepID=A0A2W4Z9A3_9SPHN|nr:MAG: bifunctional lysylphosphatidylglycerol flippase/synthetase MprF [Sphingomonas taxi]
MQDADVATRLTRVTRIRDWARIRDWIAHRRGTLIALAVLVVAVLGFAAIHKLTAEIRLSEVRAAFAALGWPELSASIALTVISYIALTFYDTIALRVIGHPLPWRTAAVASFTSYTISHNLGLAMLTGGSARYRVYSRAGLDEAAVARVVLIAGVTFWAGVITVACLSMALHPGMLPIVRWTMPPLLERSIGIAIPLAMLAIVLRYRRGGAIGLFGWRLPLPDARQALALVLVSTVDLAAASAALFVLLPGASPDLYPVLFLGYAVAIVVALISHVPGGLGVFEAVIIATMPQNNATILAALLAYRIIYYVAPLILAAVLLAFHEGRQWRRRDRTAGQERRGTDPLAIALPLAPLLLGVLVFLCGAMLLVSGALPAAPGRMDMLASVLPLPISEMAHVAASLVGVMLLFVALGLYRRLDGAFWAARLLLVTGTLLSIAKGLDYEEATVLVLTAAALQWTRAAFYRRTRLTAEPLSPEWLVGVGAAIGLSVLIGFFAYRHVGYSSDLWWRFETDANASRFLRTSLAVGLLLIGAAIWRLFAAAPVPMIHDELPRDVAEAALAHADRTDAMLAFTGDKRFLVSDSGDAFLMYQVKGASWIVIGDPVGPAEAWSELLWAIRARADAAQGRLLLYQIGLRIVPIAIEMGLKLVKYGEEATVELEGFTLDTPDMRSVRKASRVAERAGAEFAVVPATEIPAIIPELHAISDWWLADKNHAEKRFSVGRFEPGYMAKFDCAVVRIDGRIVAFANVWGTPNKQELSVDLMRHAESMPQGGMDFLFTRLMLWGHEHGYRTFSLGMAPLSGIEARRLSPTWSKVAAFLFRHGERFYGFAGLRAYKEKFRPNWTPRYIASPGGTSLLRGLIDLQALVSR